MVGDLAHHHISRRDEVTMLLLTYTMRVTPAPKAYPSNNEPEAGDASLTAAGFDAVRRLDDAFNLTHKIVMSQRDVSWG